MKTCGKIAERLGMATPYRTLGPLGRCDQVLTRVAAALNWLSLCHQRPAGGGARSTGSKYRCFIVSYRSQILLDVSHHHPLGVQIQTVTFE